MSVATQDTGPKRKASLAELKADLDTIYEDLEWCLGENDVEGVSHALRNIISLSTRIEFIEKNL